VYNTSNNEPHVVHFNHRHEEVVNRVVLEGCRPRSWSSGLRTLLLSLRARVYSVQLRDRTHLFSFTFCSPFAFLPLLCPFICPALLQVYCCVSARCCTIIVFSFIQSASVEDFCSLLSRFPSLYWIAFYGQFRGFYRVWAWPLILSI